jgi:RNA polymerase sigma-70 factor, ECF subfamily
MSPDDSFARLLAGLDAADPEAWRQLFSRFTTQLIALAGSRLDARLRQKIDPEDITQSVYCVFFRRHAAREFELQGWERLWALLAVITMNECKKCNRHFRAAGRDVGRETRLDKPGSETSDRLDLLSREPTPEQTAGLTDLVERLRQELGPKGRSVLSLVIQGCAIPEISSQTGQSPRSVYRIVNWLRERLERRAGDAARVDC